MTSVQVEELSDLLEETVQELESDEISYSFDPEDFLVILEGARETVNKEMVTELVTKVIQYVNEGKNRSRYLINRWTINETILHYGLKQFRATPELKICFSLDEFPNQSVTVSQERATVILHKLQNSGIFYSLTYEDGKEVKFLLAEENP